MFQTPLAGSPKFLYGTLCQNYYYYQFSLQHAITFLIRVDFQGIFLR